MNTPLNVIRKNPFVLRKLTCFTLFASLFSQADALHALPRVVHAEAVLPARQTPPGLLWIAKWVGNQIVSWVVGKGIDYAVNRYMLTQATQQAVDHLRTVSRTERLSAADRQTLSTLEYTYRNIHALLRRNELSDARVREEMRVWAVNIRDLRDDVSRIEGRLYQLELEQRQQLRMIVDNRGAIQDLRGQVVDLNGQLIRLDQRVATVEGRVESIDRRTAQVESIVYADPNRFLRHDSYLMLGLVYGNSVTLDRDAAFGLDLNYQYNFNKYVGFFADASFLSVKATDISGPEGSSLQWSSIPVSLGFTTHLLPPQSPLSLQVALGGGVAHSTLDYTPPPDDPVYQDTTLVITGVANVFGTGRIDVGIAPVLSEFEPVLSAGYVHFLEDLQYDGSQASSNAGNALWYVSLGLRMRNNLGNRNPSKSSSVRRQ